MSKCPKPEKYKHYSRKAAEKAMASLEAANGIDLSLHVYRCKCGKWHVGHHKQTPQWIRRTRKQMA